MSEEFIQLLLTVVSVLESAGAVLMTIGFLVSTIKFLLSFKKDFKTAFANYRRSLGRTALIGLEILVAATILKTITSMESFEGLILLMMMIVIRTFLGWTIFLEINSRWPWQRRGV